MSYYSSLLNILSQWPGLGAVVTHRLLDQFVSQKHMLRNLRELLDSIDKNPLCHYCQIPHPSHKDCRNCQKTSKDLIIFNKIIDCLIYEYIHPKSDLRHFALKNSLDHKNNHHPDEIGLHQLQKYCQYHAIENIIMLSNHSIESQATWHYIKRSLPNIHVLQARWPNPKVATLAALSSSEIEQLHNNIEELHHSTLK